jgi:hypothetical protein
VERPDEMTTALPTSPVLLANIIRDAMPSEATVVAFGGNMSPTRIEVSHGGRALVLYPDTSDPANPGWAYRYDDQSGALDDAADVARLLRDFLA